MESAVKELIRFEANSYEERTQLCLALSALGYPVKVEEIPVRNRVSHNFYVVVYEKVGRHGEV